MECWWDSSALFWEEGRRHSERPNDVLRLVSNIALQGGLDNLLKGAATQCVQNLNLTLGLPEYLGIPTEGHDHTEDGQ